jgi:NCS1 family nucleobase:cation symporter-1
MVTRGGWLHKMANRDMKTTDTSQREPYPVGVHDDHATWGIEPVPDRLRVLGMLDNSLLWGNLGVSLLVIVAGAALVPALSLPDALVAIVVGGLIGQAMLSGAAAIGAQARVPAMVLMRAPLGRRGSTLPTAVNVVQTLGWTVFELLVIATAAAALSDRLFGFRAQWLWTLVFGVVALALGLAGPIGVVRTFIRRVAVWAIPLALGYLTWWALHGSHLTALWHRPGTGGLSIWQGADIVVGITVSWIPLAADYTRFSRNERSAFVGSFAGYLVPNIALLALGTVIVLSRNIFDAASLPAAVVAASTAAVLALLALTVGETDDAFANAYSAAVSLQNLTPAVPLRLLVTLTTALGTLGALTIDLVSYQTFLLLLGSVFVPLFAVLLADWLLAGAHYDREDIFDAHAWRPGLIAAWIAGFALYQWLYPTGPQWWVDLVGKLQPPSWGIGATVPSFAFAFGLALCIAAVERRRLPAFARAQR